MDVLLTQQPARRLTIPSVPDRGFVALFTFPGFVTVGVPGRQVYIEAKSNLGEPRGIYDVLAQEFFAATKLVLELKEERC